MDSLWRPTESARRDHRWYRNRVAQEAQDSMTETIIMLIRHGEKPGEDGPPHGIDRDGERDPHALSVRGWTRAGALAAAFSRLPTAAHPALVVPERIIATRSTADYHSKREIDTATPIARRLGIEVDTSYGHDESAQLRSSVITDGRPTLIVWHHGSMTDLIRSFPIGNPAELPEKWPDHRFDLIWVLTRGQGQADFRFVPLNQDLLDGDEPSG